MSTKIANGYRLPTEHLPQFVAAANTALHTMFVDLFRQLTATTADRLIREVSADQVATDGDQRDGTVRLKRLVEKVVRAEAARGEASPMHDDRDVSCAYTAVFDPADRQWVYLLLYPQHPAYQPVWDDLAHVEEFAYWNDVDQPDHVTDVEWQQRRDRWTSVLGRRPPGHVGLTYEASSTSADPVAMAAALNDLGPLLGHDPAYLDRWVPIEWANSRLHPGDD